MEEAEGKHASVPSPTFQLIQQLTNGRTNTSACVTSQSPKPSVLSKSNSLLSRGSELQRTLNIKLPSKLLGDTGLSSCVGTTSKGWLLHTQSSSSAWGGPGSHGNMANSRASVNPFPSWPPHTSFQLNILDVDRVYSSPMLEGQWGYSKTANTYVI